MHIYGLYIFRHLGYCSSGFLTNVINIFRMAALASGEKQECYSILKKRSALSKSTSVNVANYQFKCANSVPERVNCEFREPEKYPRLTRAKQQIA